MGWQFKWVSSFGSDFNYDYHVSFTKEEMTSGKAYYNYETRFPSEEGPGASVFYRQGTRFFTRIPPMRVVSMHPCRHTTFLT